MLSNSYQFIRHSSGLDPVPIKKHLHPIKIRGNNLKAAEDVKPWRSGRKARKSGLADNIFFLPIKRQQAGLLQFNVAFGSVGRLGHLEIPHRVLSTQQQTPHGISDNRGMVITISKTFTTSLRTVLVFTSEFCLIYTKTTAR